MSAMKQENYEEDDEINKESVTGEEESEFVQDIKNITNYRFLLAWVINSD